MGNRLKLGVNVDHIATVRQARGVDYPSPVEGALLALKAGAHGITIHLREDRRHIQDADLFEMRKKIHNDILNLEMADVSEIVEIAIKARPDEVCIVPEKRQELTTEGGLDVIKNKASLARTIEKLSKAGIRVSLFIDPDEEQIDATLDVGAPVIELHTGTYCDAKKDQAKAELKRLIAAAQYAHKKGLQVNAGHGINLKNISGILKVPHLDTLNIGHSIIARSIMVGIKAAVKEMLLAMRSYKG